MSIDGDVGMMSMQSTTSSSSLLAQRLAPPAEPFIEPNSEYSYVNSALALIPIATGVIWGMGSAIGLSAWIVTLLGAVASCSFLVVLAIAFIQAARGRQSVARIYELAVKNWERAYSAWAKNSYCSGCDSVVTPSEPARGIDTEGCLAARGPRAAQENPTAGQQSIR